MPTGPDQVVLTSRGVSWLRERLDHVLAELATVSRPDVPGADRSPDHEAQARRLVVEVDDLTRALARAVTVVDVTEDPSIVELGDEVDVEFDDGTTDTFVLVHPLEAPMDDASISVESPLARALLGARPGDRVEVAAPAGSYTCVVLARRRAS